MRNWFNGTTFSALVAIGIFLAGVASTYFFYISGSIPPKQLTANFNGPTDPLNDLAKTGVDISVDVKSGGQPLDSLYIYNTSLKNTGRAPILPSDYAGDLVLTASEAWRIVAIGPQHFSRGDDLGVVWKKVDDRTYRSAAPLLNPGDTINIAVYLTTTEQEYRKRLLGAPPLKWTARAANLGPIIIAPSFAEQFASEMGPIYVTIWGWGVPFVLAMFALSLAAHLWLISRLMELRDWRAQAVLLVSGLISVSFAECVNTLVHGPLIGVSADGWINWPSIFANIAMIIGLEAWRRRRIRASGEGRTISEDL